MPLRQRARDTNRLTVSLMLSKLGCDVIDLGVIADDPAALRHAFTTADSQADVVISTGGVSVGEADFTREILNELRRIGEDIRAGHQVLAAGVRLGAAELPLLASLGIARVTVRRRLRVAIFSTGDELQAVGEPLAEGQI
ncbi:hypothetical protein CRX72_12655 [Pantoea sp. BRM17]|nr:hypothetical protein CRX72_12655 [Pantoea sp. BRM17]